MTTNEIAMLLTGMFTGSILTITFIMAGKTILDLLADYFAERYQDLQQEEDWINGVEPIGSN